MSCERQWGVLYESTTARTQQFYRGTCIPLSEREGERERASVLSREAPRA